MVSLPNMISLQISDEQAERFAEVYKEEYGEDMTIPEARAAIQDVLPLIDLLSRPVPENREERIKLAHRVLGI